MLSNMEYLVENVSKPNVMIDLQLDDGNKIKLSSTNAILHGILWIPYYRLGRNITINEIYPIKNVTPETVSEVQTIQYRHLMEEVDMPYMDIVKLLWDTVITLYKFVHANLGEYSRSISLMSLIHVTDNPAVKKIIETDIPSELGTKVAEIRFNELSKELLDVLEDPKAIPNNPMLPFMDSGVFNRNQLPQLMMAYGARSDLDDQMQKHVINESSLSGLKTVKDYATEALSAKKTSFYLKDVISKTQYFARVLRLNNMQFRKKYKGDCGSTYVAPITIATGTGKNFVDKVVFHHGKKVIITKNNYKELEGHRVEMISPLGCKYHDGICERCAGRATTKPWAFMPDIHLGNYSKSKLCAKISQKVLSAKHLIKTTSIEPKLFDCAKRYLCKKSGSTNIVFCKTVNRSLKNIAVVVPYESMKHIGDLHYGQTAESFSLLEQIAFKNTATEQMDEIKLGEPQFMLHFSEEMLEHIKTVYPDIELVDGNYEIPMKGFKASDPFISYVVINDDMVAFSDRVKNMISNNMASYNSASSALIDLANIIYTKTNLNIFFIELVVKSLMSRPITCDTDVDFSKLREGIIDSSVASKLAHEDIRRYLQQASTCVVPKGDSPIDIFFGF